MVADVCALKLPGVTPEKVAMAVQRRSKRADIRVAYELLLDSKKARHRKEGVSVCGDGQFYGCLQCCAIVSHTYWHTALRGWHIARGQSWSRRDCRKSKHVLMLTLPQGVWCDRHGPACFGGGGCGGGESRGSFGVGGGKLLAIRFTCLCGRYFFRAEVQFLPHVP